MPFPPTDKTMVGLLKDITERLTLIERRQVRRIDGSPGGGTTPPPSRQVLAYTTAVLAAAAQESGALTAAPSFDVFDLSADRACRVRLYDTVAHRNADAARPIGTLPTATSPNHGCFLEVILDAAGTQTITDGVFVSLPAGNAVPITVTNRSSTNAAVAVTMTVLAKE